MYATSWFVTYFANKIEKVDIVCELWKEIIALKDNKFIFLVSIALIIYNRNTILNSNKGDMPIVMAQLTIKNRDELFEILLIAH